MDYGINLLAGQTLGRVEIADRKEFDQWTIRPSREVVKKIERLDQLTLAAEQRLGTFIVG